MAVINCRPRPLLNPLGLLLTSSSCSFTKKTVANQKDPASFIVEHSSTRCTVIPRRSIASCRRFQRRRLDRHCRLDAVIHTHVGLAESMKLAYGNSAEKDTRKLVSVLIIHQQSGVLGQFILIV